MPKSVNATLKAKAALSKNNPIYLVTIALSGATVRLTDNNADIVFPSSGGSTYTAWGMSFSSIRNNLTGEIDRVTIQLDNTSKAMSSYLVNYNFPGCTLTISRVFGDLLSSASYSMIVFSGIMGAPYANEQALIVTATSPLMRTEQQGGRLYQNLCAWEFKSTECAYAGGSSSCDKTAKQCQNYGNIANFGGFNYIPYTPVN